MLERYMLLLPVILAFAPGANAWTINSLFNPMDYAVLTNNLNVTSGMIAIDTKNGSSAPTLTTPDLTVLYGIVVTNQSANVVLALFNFGSLGISNAGAGGGGGDLSFTFMKRGMVITLR
jgi:hypothetical protein